MASIRARADNHMLFLDFRFRGNRCREQTLLEDTPANRKRLAKVAEKIEELIATGSFNYRDFFPNSKNAVKFDLPEPPVAPLAVEPPLLQIASSGRRGGSMPCGPARSVRCHLFRPQVPVGAASGRLSSRPCIRRGPRGTAVAEGRGRSLPRIVDSLRPGPLDESSCQHL